MRDRIAAGGGSRGGQQSEPDEPALAASGPAHSGSQRLRFEERDTAVWYGSNLVGRLTASQWRILRYLAEHQDHWVSAQELLAKALDTAHQPDSSLVRVYVHQLRKALGPIAIHLETDRRGRLGYRWSSNEHARD